MDDERILYTENWSVCAIDSFDLTIDQTIWCVTESGHSEVSQSAAKKSIISHLSKEGSIEWLISVIFKNSGPENGLSELIGILYDHGLLFVEQTSEIKGVDVVVFSKFSKAKGDSFWKGTKHFF